MSENVSISKTLKEPKKLPKGAKVLRKDVRINVEQIENGFIVCKNVEYKYEMPGGKGGVDWLYLERKWFTEEDPLEVKLGTEDKDLAASFEED